MCKIISRAGLASKNGKCPLTSRGALAMEDERKRSKSEGERSEARRTLFVRNLPYSTTDDQLSSVFAEYGGVKTCFTVKEKGITDRCKGYGYVLFEKREDAEKAKSGVKKVKGRPVQVVFADRRPVREKQQGVGGEKEEQEVTILPETELIDDIESESEGSEEGSGYDDDLMSDDDDNMSASSSTIRPRKPRSQRRQARYGVGRVVVVTGVPRELPRGKLRKKCSKYGPLEEFVYPVATTEEDGAEGVKEAKAHVTYVNYADARKAVAGLKGLKFSSTDNPLATVLMSREGKTVSKATLTKSRLIVRNISFSVTSKDLLKMFSCYGNVQEVHIPRKPNGYMRGFAFVQFTSYFDAARALEGVNGVEIKGRPVAVDWVVPKATYETSLQTEKNEEERKEEEEEQEEEEMQDEEDDDESEEEMEAEGEEEEVEEKEEREEKMAAKKEFRPDVHKGTTVFVRNLPLDSSEDELKELFSQFGRVRYSRIVMDKTTGLSRGSAFVQFLKAASVQQCIESLESCENVLLYNGRELDVSLALSPQELAKMRERGSEKTDKRNLYLAKEGNILPGSEAAKNLTKAELAKCLKAQAEKKAKLANPNFYVSKTRLSVRNLPTQTTESQLREIFNSAIDSGKIVQLKILRSKDRVDANGIGRSKGFAFVEFSTHEVAVAALRATNNNPSLFPSRKRLIVEFAVEDARIMKTREERKKRQQQKKISDGGPKGGQNSGLGGQGADGREEGEKRKNRKVEWQVKCKEKRMRRRERKKQTIDKDRPLLTNPERNGDGEDRKSNKSRDDQGKHEKADISKRKGQRVRKVEKVAKGVNEASEGLGIGDGEKESVAQRRKRSHDQTDESIGGADGFGSEKKVKLSRKQSRNARKRGREQREEERFADMVDSYRRKLSSLHS